jgi:hypothetical protein
MRLAVAQLSFCVSHGIPIASAAEYSSNTEQNPHASSIDDPTIHAAAIGICVPARTTCGSNVGRRRSC